MVLDLAWACASISQEILLLGEGSSHMLGLSTSFPIIGRRDLYLLKAPGLDGNWVIFTGRMDINKLLSWVN